MTAETLSKFIARRRIFTIEEVQAKLRPAKSSSTLKNSLGYHLKKGHIIRIRRGIYYVVPVESTPGGCQVDPYLLCSSLTTDAVLSYHTALAFYGKLHSVRNDFVYTTERKVKGRFAFQGLTYRGVAPPKNLTRSDSLDFGVQILPYLGHQLRVTSLERTFVDLLDRPELTGEWEEIWRSLEAIEYLDLDVVLTYVTLLKISTSIAKVGLFLELHKDELMVEENYLNRLSQLVPKQPHYLDRRSKGKSKLIKRWNLVVPRDLLERRWEEPHEDV